MMTLISTHYHDDPNSVRQAALKVVPRSGKYLSEATVENSGVTLPACKTKGGRLIRRMPIWD